MLRKKIRKNKPQTNTHLILNNFVNLLSLKTSHSDTPSDSLVITGGYITSTTEPCSCVQEVLRDLPHLLQSKGTENLQHSVGGRADRSHATNRALHLPCHHYINLMEGHKQMWEPTLLLWDSCCLAHQHCQLRLLEETL